eukprot:TRINITY_DN50_c1_g1_i1.p1 TRINITY_DN50_c1_g1~~TRINITY_DN50_c1_g1_i1.p1  ORF type:complete len:966 (-),score=71.76 TRINITY_DN50_c1_g1_i1:1283-4180(-)
MRSCITYFETLLCSLTLCFGFFKDRFEVIKAKLFSFQLTLITFDGSLVGDFASMAAYLVRRKFLVITWFNLLNTLACYLVYPIHPSIMERGAFVCALFYMLCAIFCVIPSKNIDCVKYCGLAYMVSGYLLGFYISYTDPFRAILMVSLLFIGFCFVVDSFAVGLSVTTFSGVFGAIIYRPQTNCWGFLRTSVNLTAIYAFLWVLMRTHDIIITEHWKRYFETREEVATETQSKTMFMASISHDLKNPLNSLLGCIDQLKTSVTLTKSDKQHLKTASFSGQILTYLINNILDIAKIQVGKFEVDRLPMSITEEVNKILRIERELSKKKGIALYKKYATPIPSWVYGDPMRFTEVLLNLIGNSIKFTSRGYVAVIFKWGRNVKEIEDLESDPEPILPKEIITKKSNTKKRSLFSQHGIASKPTMNDDLGNEEDVNEEISEGINEKMSKYNLLVKNSWLNVAPKSPLKITYSYSLPSTQQKMAANKTCENKGMFSTEVVRANNSGGASTGIGLMRQNKTFRNTPVEDDKELDSSEEKEDDCDSVFDLDNSEFGDTGILAVDIIDTGVGMTKEEQDRLFKPFTQANPSVKSQFGGTGLGLWISRQLIHLMSGFIEVKSQKGKGSRFRITLPLKVVSKEVAYSMKSAEEDKLGSAELAVAKPKRFCLTQTFSRLALEMRSIGWTKFRGNKNTLNGMKILVVENERCKDDRQMKQIINQLKCTDCEIYYTTFAFALRTLKENNYKFDSIIVLSTTQPLATKKLVTLVMKTMKDSNIKPIPYAIASGMTFQEQQKYRYSNTVGVCRYIQGIPDNLPAEGRGFGKHLNEDAQQVYVILFYERNRLKQAISGNYGNIVDEVYEKYNKKQEAYYNPCTIAKVLLADDDILSNLALRSMIEQTGLYKVFTFYNGVDVSPLTFTHFNRLANSMRIEEKNLRPPYWIWRCPNGMGQRRPNGSENVRQENSGKVWPQLD